ncbi:MAG: hypothetical protein KA715_06035 [Xanthomonadaceae bacterium]|nr:hypothetical protein [Xanthomonadaceae bacterium]
MKNQIMSVFAALIVAFLNSSSSSAADITYKCVSKQMGKFSISFNGKGAQTNFDTLIDGRGDQKFYDITRDEDYEEEEGYDRYVYATREGKAEFYFEAPFAQGGRKLKNGKVGGYIQINISFRSGLRLPQQYTVLCNLPIK